MRPVRTALRLVTAGAGLQAGQAAVAGWLLLRYPGLVDRLGPWTRDEALLINTVYLHLTGAFVLAAGLSVLLAGAALAVPRRTPYTRALVGTALLLVAVALMIGVVYSPDSVLLSDGELQQRHLQPLLPLWFTVAQAVAFIGVIACSALAMVRLSRAEADEYYHLGGPRPAWKGFTSWLDVEIRGAGSDQGA
ncbi:hypothetical protein [Dactylosporangium sp. CA-092794]|uniref:hypothetical protein n=1 Tax=Dactylosporangium sp. CA-092794 TaxID=3239929 RepID=UPI003D91BA9B